MYISPSFIRKRIGQPQRREALFMISPEMGGCSVCAPLTSLSLVSKVVLQQVCL